MKKFNSLSSLPACGWSLSSPVVNAGINSLTSAIYLSFCAILALLRIRLRASVTQLVISTVFPLGKVTLPKPSVYAKVIGLVSQQIGISISSLPSASIIIITVKFCINSEESTFPGLIKCCTLSLAERVKRGLLPPLRVKSWQIF